MRIETLRQTLLQSGARDCHIERALRAWLMGASLDSGPRGHQAENFYPLTVRAVLAQWAQTLPALVKLHARYPAGDGSARLLVELTDGQMVESVLLPREGVCVSSQVGCAVGCAFCMTGQSGLLRQLGSAEIAAQVILARSMQPIRRVVFMGMGEPAHNLDNVLEAIDLLGRIGGIGHKNLVFSTVGDRRVFERLPEQIVKPALAISLHTTRHALRRKLLPRAPDIPPEELVELAETYARKTHYPIQYQWTLLDGVNDGEEELEGLIRLLRGKYAIMNFIPFNAVEGAGFTRPPQERLAWLAGQLHQNGILVRLRQSAGQEVDGGCGQLRARALGKD